MITPPKVSLVSCEPINDFVLRHLKNININFYSFTKSYKNNKRFTLSSDPKFIDLYFSTKHYEVDWVGFDKALEIFSDCIITWQYCHEEHVACNIWKVHQEVSDTKIYILLHFQFDDYCESHVFGTRGDIISGKTDTDKELSIMLNNKDLFKRFVQYFKSSFHTTIQEAENTKYRVLNIKHNIQEFEHFSYWGAYLNEIKAFYKATQSEKIYLQGIYDKIYLTREEAQMIKHFFYGATYREIGLHYNLSVRSIEMRFSKIKEKLNAKTKVDLKNLIIKHKVMKLIKVSL